MKVFVSWSGERGLRVARGLSKFVRQLLRVETWISSEMPKGSHWPNELAKQLEQTKLGISVLTRDSLAAPWLLFEAGALAKTQDARVCTVLLDLMPEDVPAPLGFFQHTRVEHDDMLRLAHTINDLEKGTGGGGHTHADLEELFHSLWPTFRDEIKAIALPAEEPNPLPLDLLKEIKEAVIRLPQPQFGKTSDRRGLELEGRFLLQFDGKQPKHALQEAFLLRLREIGTIHDIATLTVGRCVGFEAGSYENDRKRFESVLKESLTGIRWTLWRRSGTG